MFTEVIKLFYNSGFFSSWQLFNSNVDSRKCMNLSAQLDKANNNLTQPWLRHTETFTEITYFYEDQL